MLESLINPKRVEKGPWKMFFIGLLYASLSLLLVHWFFANDAVLSKASGILVVTFCVMFSLPFMYFIIKKEEGIKFSVVENAIIVSGIDKAIVGNVAANYSANRKPGGAS